MVKVLFYSTEEDLLADLQSGGNNFDRVPDETVLGFETWIFINLGQGHCRWREVQHRGPFQKLYLYKRRNAHFKRFDDDLMLRLLVDFQISQRVSNIAYLYQ
jgi:hypothetical protein